MKRLLAILLLLVPITATVGSVFCAPAFAVDSALSVLSDTALSAQSAILMEAEDRAVLYEKNAASQMGMASTTKIMTALIAAEALAPDTLLTVPREAVGIEGSSVYLVEGERLTAKELLYALMLASANDAATALAISVSGSVEQFCQRMNERAAALGLRNTHFENPHGLASDGHYTTAYDLALLSATALEHPLLREIVSTQKTTIPFDSQADGRYLLNHNKMLKQYKGAIGLKTGFTKKTGRCLVSAAVREGMTLIAVTLDAPNDWKDHTLLLDYGFSTYQRLTLFDTGCFSYSLPLAGGTEAAVTLRNRSPITMLLPKDHRDPVWTVETLQRPAFAPISKGQILGRLICRCDGKEVISELMVTQDYPASFQGKKSLWQRIADTLLAWLDAFRQIFVAKE